MFEMNDKIIINKLSGKYEKGISNIIFKSLIINFEEINMKNQ